MVETVVAEVDVVGEVVEVASVFEVEVVAVVESGFGSWVELFALADGRWSFGGSRCEYPE